MESLLNLGADEVDIRTIQRNFSLVDSEVRSDSTCREAGSSEALPLAVEQRLEWAYVPSVPSCCRPGNDLWGAE